MSNYLKYKPGWVQLLTFGFLVIIVFFIARLEASFIIAKFYHLSEAEIMSMDLKRLDVVSALKVVQVVISIGLFFIPSLLFATFSDPKPLTYIGFKSPVPIRFLLIAPIVIVAAFPMVAWLSELNQHLHLPRSMQATEKLIRDAESQNNDLLHSFLDMKSPADLVITLFILAVIPAIAEEFFFRGVLQRLFISLTKNPWAGIIVTSVIFSMLHGFLGFFPRLVLGMLLGALFWYSGSLWTCILAHFVNNAVQVILMYYNPKFVDKDPEFSVLLVAASTFLVIALTWWMRKISQTRFAEVYDTDDDFHIGPRDNYVS